MNRTLHTAMDHCTLLNRDIRTSADVFYPLGFVSDGNRTALCDEVADAFVPSIRFVFDNAYFECTKFPAEIREFSSLLTSEAGIHMLTMLTGGAEEFRNALLAQGMETPEIMVTSRENTDHGEAKGTAVFHIVNIPECAIPDTHIGCIEHKNRELIYQPSRYAHPNSADTYEELVMCTDNEALAAAIEGQIQVLSSVSNAGRIPGGGVPTFRILDEASFKERFGYEAGAERNIFSALVFGVSDMERCRGFVERSGLDFCEKDGMLCVNATEQVSLVICFRRRKI